MFQSGTGLLQGRLLQLLVAYDYFAPRFNEIFDVKLLTTLR